MSDEKSVPKLDDNNYPVWSRLMEAHLVEKDLWQAVSDPTSLTDEQKAANVVAKAKAAMVKRMKPHLLLTLVMPKDTASDVWKRIQREMAGRSQSRQLDIHQELMSLKLGNKETITSYYGRMIQLREALASAGVSITDDQARLFLFGGLPKVYLPTVQSLNVTKTPFGELLGHLRLAENAINGGGKVPNKQGDDDGAALSVTPQFCKYCKKKGHTVKTCFKKQRDDGKSGDKPRCNYCNKVGHTEEECRIKKSDAKSSSGAGNLSVAYVVRVPNPSNLDKSDYQLEEALFQALARQYGPFDVDAAASVSGDNAQCPRWYSRDNSFLAADVSGCKVWLNPPFDATGSFIDHYRLCKQRDPANTSACIVVPYCPKASWWPQLQGMTMVRHWFAGQQLFTLPGKHVGDTRRRVLPSPCDVAVFYDPPDISHEVAEVVNHRNVRKKTADEVPLILDSGATSHMTCVRSLLHHYTTDLTGFPKTIRVANAEEVPVKGRGTIKVLSTVANNVTEVCFKNVLHVPSLDVTLISLRRLDQQGVVAVFANDKCKLSKDGTEFLFATVRKRKSLFDAHPELYTLANVDIIAASPPGSAAPVTQPPAVDAAQLWHSRMGHLGYRSLSQMPDLVTGMDADAQLFNLKSRDKSVCAPCVLGKQTRHPRVSSSQVKSTVPLFRLHADLCGPMQTSSLGGAAYFLLVIDEATRYSVLQPLRSKDQAAEHLMHIIMRLQSLTGRSVCNLRTDRGGEFVTADLKSKLGNLGITHETTPAHSPESNGMAERTNRTILDKVRSILCGASLPKMFWAEAAVHANMLRNISPCKGVSRTPWELIHGSCPDVSMLRNFGALCYIHTPDQLRKKLDHKAEPAVLLGTDLKSGMYRVYRNGTVNSYKDVTVDESKLGWKTSADDEVLTPADYPSYLYSSQQQASEESESDSDDEGHPAPVPTPPVRRVSFAPSTRFVSVPLAGTDQGPSQLSGQPLQDGPEQSADPAPTPRRSARVSKPPDFYRPGQANSAQSEVDHRDPESVKQAQESPQWSDWKQAMQSEYDALMSNGTWELVQIPDGVKPLPCRWLFKTKYNADGSIERYKARLVAGGHKQREGVDYDDVYAPVSRHTSFRTLLAKVAAEDLELHCLDISNAFLNGVLDDPVYMKQPELFSNGDPNVCCKLVKSLYGLHQAPQEWYKVLTAHLQDIGFRASENDRGVWFRAASAVYIVMWVDDFLIACKSLSELQEVKQQILSKFKGRDLGEVHTYLSIKIERDRANHKVKISQPGHVTDILARFGMSDCSPKDIPMSPGADVSKARDDDKPLDSSLEYMECVGALLYLANCTRPDLSYAVNVLSKQSSHPTERHWIQLKGVLKYLAGTKQHGIVYRGDTELKAWTDSDYAACKDSRRSRSGFVFTVGGGAVSWMSKQQTVVAASTAEAEYVAAFATTKEAIWLKRLSAELGVGEKKPLRIWSDNQACNQLAVNGALNNRTKHIDIAYHFVRDAVSSNVIRLVHCASAENAADFFTKPLSAPLFSKFCHMIGIE